MAKPAWSANSVQIGFRHFGKVKVDHNIDGLKKKGKISSNHNSFSHKWKLQFSTRSLRQMLCGSLVKICNLANHMKRQNIKFYWWKTVNWGSNAMFFVILFSNSKMWTQTIQRACTELTLEIDFIGSLVLFISLFQNYLFIWIRSNLDVF